MELIEDGLHLVLAGHTEHGDEHDGACDADCAEHGCAPTSHRCNCCTAQQVLPAHSGVAVPACRVVVVRWAERSPDEGPRGVTRALLRPPSA
jgi:hypothetical protein